MKAKHLVILGLVSSGLILAGCGETVTPEKAPKAVSQTTTQPSGEQKETAETPKAPTTYKLGERVKVGELAITVNSVNKTKGGQIIKAADGKVFVLVDATIENLGKEPARLSSIMMFKLSDSEGYSYNGTFPPDNIKGGTLDGELAPTKKLRGNVAFEVAKDAKGLELAFAPDPLESTEATFTIQ